MKSLLPLPRPPPRGGAGFCQVFIRGAEGLAWKDDDDDEVEGSEGD